jgi:hypothetical protein
VKEREKKEGKKGVTGNKLYYQQPYTSPHTKEDTTTFSMTQGKGDFGSHD